VHWLLPEVKHVGVKTCFYSLKYDVEKTQASWSMCDENVTLFALRHDMPSN